MSSFKMTSKYKRKMIMLGKTGTGKSSLGNVLLRRRAFGEAGGFNAVTTECRLGRDTTGSISVVDTPGLFSCDGERSLAKQALEVQKAIKLCPNPHAFLIVLNGSGRLTQEELSSIDVLRLIFGEQCLEKAIIVLTHIENTIGKTQLRTMLAGSDEISHLIKECGGRLARIDNTDPKPEHIEHIIRLVDKVSRTGKYSFKNDYIHVHARVLRAALENHDSGPAHVQTRRLSKQIKTAVDEEKAFKKKFWKVAGVCAICVTVGVAYCVGGGTTAAAVHNNSSVIVAVGLGNFATVSH